MAEEPGEQSHSLFRPPMSDLELDLECQRGTRLKVAGPLTTQTIQEEVKAASTEERALQLQGTDFYLPLHGLFKCICRSGANAEKVFRIC